MQPHQQRVVDEKSELDAKREKLHAFIGGAIFSDLEEAEKERLMQQSEAMKDYSHILGERIEAFT